MPATPADTDARISLTIRSIANVALPTLARPETLNTSQTGLQWIVDAYALVFAGLLLPAGALGDRFGRKGALQAGLAVFALADVCVLKWLGLGRGVAGTGVASHGRV